MHMNSDFVLWWRETEGARERERDCERVRERDSKREIQSHVKTCTTTYYSETEQISSADQGYIIFIGSMSADQSASFRVLYSKTETEREGLN